MCFSATASFTLAGALVPLGAITLANARGTGSPLWPFAVYPLAFGLQQAIEGALWLGIGAEDPALTIASARGFLFFSHFFWLAWVPLSVWLTEPPGPRRRGLGWLSVIGCLFGLSIFLPAALLRDWLYVEVIHRSIEYRTTLIYEGIVSRTALKLFYAAIVVSALLLSSHRHIRIFGALVAVSLVATYGLFAYAFISVWCFFAAILSAYLAWVVIARPARGTAPPG